MKRKDAQLLLVGVTIFLAVLAPISFAESDELSSAEQIVPQEDAGHSDATSSPVEALGAECSQQSDNLFPFFGDSLSLKSEEIPAGGSCQASVTCTGFCSNLTIFCYGVDQCIVGSTYVECDGERRDCPEQVCTPPSPCVDPCNYCLCIQSGLFTPFRCRKEHCFL